MRFTTEFKDNWIGWTWTNVYSKKANWDDNSQYERVEYASGWALTFDRASSAARKEENAILRD